MRALADGAVLLELTNAEALDLAAQLAVSRPDGLFDAVPGARTLLVLFDPDRFDPARLAELRATGSVPAPRTVRLPAVYDGPDLAEISAQTRLPVGELVRLHTRAVHVVAFLGFAPGFAYMTGAPRELALPRLKTPRVRVPAGSLAVADGYSGIYPAETPGGWRLIGRVAARMFDPDASPPALLRPGDHVVFESVAELPTTVRGLEPAPRGEPVLRVIAPGPFTSIQGGPRYGLSSSGVPAGGAMDLPALAAANALLDNAPDAAGLEYTVAGPTLEALARVRIGVNGAVRELAPGERLNVPALTSGLRGYIAIGGRLALPRPGEPTRALRAGDLLRKNPGHNTDFRPPGREISIVSRVSRVSVRALPGPQWDSFDHPEHFFESEYTITPQSDRRGLRLQGPALGLKRADIPPEGTAPGAVQVPGDGLPIVLGPDRPVTGGYPKVATVISADLPLLAQARPGARIRFRQVSLDDALRARKAAR